MLGRLDVLRIVSNKLRQCQTAGAMAAPMYQRDVTIEMSRRLICAIDFIWSQAQLGHPKELIIQESALNLWEIVFKRFVKYPDLPTFDGT